MELEPTAKNAPIIKLNIFIVSPLFFTLIIAEIATMINRIYTNNWSVQTLHFKIVIFKYQFEL